MDGCLRWERGATKVRNARFRAFRPRTGSRPRTAPSAKDELELAWTFLAAPGADSLRGSTCGANHELDLALIFFLSSANSIGSDLQDGTIVRAPSTTLVWDEPTLLTAHRGSRWDTDPAAARTSSEFARRVFPLGRCAARGVARERPHRRCSRWDKDPAAARTSCEFARGRAARALVQRSRAGQVAGSQPVSEAPRSGNGGSQADGVPPSTEPLRATRKGPRAVAHLRHFVSARRLLMRPAP